MTPPLAALTDREEEVLRCIARGHGMREIGSLLGMAEGTAKWHRENILRKLGARNSADAVRIYVERKAGVSV